MTERAPLPPIKFTELADALLARAGTLVPAWLPGGTLRGHEYICGSLSGGVGNSCSVNLITGKWADFQTEDKGNDLTSLYAAINGLSQQMGKAAAQVAREEGLEDVAGVQHARADAPPVVKPVRPAPVVVPASSRDKERWDVIQPVPDFAPPFQFNHYHYTDANIEHVAEYRIDAALFGYIVRVMRTEGGKLPLPYTWCKSERDGSMKWLSKSFAEPRPLYFPGHASPVAAAGVSQSPVTVVLVEGEKKADVLQALLDAYAPSVYVVASWPGGCKAWKKADWSWLQGCNVLLWPDCDGKREPLTKVERDSCQDDLGRDVMQATKPLLPANKQPGMAAMLGIGALLRADQGCTVQLLPIPAPLEVVDGWDCADAINTNGWTGERVLQFFGGAYALPAAGSDAAEAAAAEKKSMASLPLESGDDDCEGFELISGRRIPGWLACYYDKPNKRWLASRKMVILILERDPVLAPVLAYNELSNNVQSRVLWPWPHAQVGDVTDAVDLLLGKYLTDTYGLPSISRAALTEAIQTVAHTRRFHPIREYLDGVKWDGVTRIDKWLIYALGESPDTLSAPMREYLQIVGRCWLLGMVNRVMKPGCKFDYCPVLEGAGGLRKSTLVEALAGRQYFSDTPFEVGRGKEAQEQVQGLWLYEIAELTHFNKSEVGAIKAFITSMVDRYRVAYGSTVGSFPRQCVLVGTTNENTYLRDRTGNRRFWPIPVKHVIDTDWIIKRRDQLLAEAYELFKQGVAYTPTTDQERRLFVPMQESRLVETGVVSELQYLLTRDPIATANGQIVNNLTGYVTMAQLTKALEVDPAKSTPALEAQIRAWLDHEGWQRVKKQVNGARAWGYVRPDNWPQVEADDDMTAPPPPKPVVPASTERPGDDVPF